MNSRRVPTRTRPPVEQDRVAAEVRKAVRTGRLVPGERLPSRLVLAARHQVSSLTVQRAMNQLLEDGFIETRPRQGTFVAQRPPHQYRIGLAFQPRRHDPSWSNLWDALLAATEVVADKSDYRFETYLGVDGHLDSDDSRRLRRDLERRALAGVVFDQFSVQAASLLPLKRFDIPAVGILKKESIDGLSGIALDLVSFFDQALAYLKDAGCRRIAVIALGKPDIWEMLSKVQECYATHGLEYRPEWVQGIPLPGRDWAVHTVRLLFGAVADCRPDAVIVADDNLTEPVAEGLTQLGLTPPGDLRAVSICNWPKLPQVEMDFEWLGFDLVQVLELAIDMLRTTCSSAIPGGAPDAWAARANVKTATPMRRAGAGRSRR